MKRWNCVVAVVVVLGLAGGVWGQALVDRVPDDAMVYVGWRGTENMGAGYEGSHLKKIVEGSDWGKVFGEFVPAIVAKVQEQDVSSGEKLQMVSDIASAMWRHESAFYFGGMIAGQGGPPAPKLAVLIRAGGEAGALVKEIQGALDKVGPMPVEVKVGTYGDLVAVTTGAWPGFEALLNGQAGAAGALKGNAKFAAAMGQVHQEPVAAVYVDVEAIVKMVDGFVALGVPPEQQKIWRSVRQILGLGGIQQAVMTGAFDGKDWMTEGFIGAPAPRQGLAAMWDGGPMSDEVLKLIPQDVTMMTAARFDLARLVGQTRKSVTAANEDWGAVVDQAMAQASSWAGLDIEKDLLSAFGEDWGMYISPRVGGTGLFGMCFVNRPRDAAKLETSLGILEKQATNSIAQLIQGKVTVAFKTRQVDGVTLHYLAVPIVTPTWAIVDGNLYVGLYPQVVVAAADYVKGGAATIVQNEKFAAIRQRLGMRSGMNSVAFSDLAQTAPNAYSSWLLITRYAGVADLFGIESPLMLMPPIDRLMAELEPAGQTSWVDDAGMHMRAVTPFPGAGVLAQDPLGSMMMVQPAVMASIMLPALNRARGAANRVKSMANLRQIGQGLFLYGNEHREKFPASLGDLVMEEPLAMEVFVNPSGNTVVPKSLVDKQKMAEWVNENSDYVYLGKGKSEKGEPDMVLAYEKPEINGNEGFNLLFEDGHVEYKNYEEGMKLVNEQKAKDQK
ncbi:MAG TPA: DUF3352 domain-containing protein [Tepidisphaeraceae bacterium]|nr:DUF3352 domain-containing protein [Tepidisphaeraceae bacterium]